MPDDQVARRVAWVIHGHDKVLAGRHKILAPPSTRLPCPDVEMLPLGPDQLGSKLFDRIRSRRYDVSQNAFRQSPNDGVAPFAKTARKRHAEQNHSAPRGVNLKPTAR